LTEITVLPQKIVDRRIIFLKSRLDPTMARLLGEKVKGKFFTRLRFLKPKPEEIRLISIDKYYEPYVLVSGKYAIDYCRKHVYSVNVDKNAREVAFFDRKFKPEPLSQPPDGAQVIKLDGVEFFHYEDEASFVLDKIGREIDPEQLPCAPSEKLTVEELTKTGIKFAKVKISLEEEIDFLRSRIVNRPSDVGEVIREIFEVSERALIYCPMYQLTCRNVKTGKEAIAKIDGTTGKTLSCKSDKANSNKFMRDFFEDNIENIQQVGEKLVESKQKLPEPRSATDGFNSPKEIDMISNEIAGSPPVSVSEVKRNIGFPEVLGEVFHTDDNVTVEGDLEIPSKTIVYENLEVKGYLTIGTDCQIFGKIKALRDILIGVNTKIEGNVVSGGDISSGTNSVIRGSVESAGHVEIGENAVIEGGLHSKS
jgi:Zn-finger protein/cytoskeletal protein CcmA (bactofilin family)